MKKLMHVKSYSKRAGQKNL